MMYYKLCFTKIFRKLGLFQSKTDFSGGLGIAIAMTNSDSFCTCMQNLLVEIFSVADNLLQE